MLTKAHHRIKIVKILLLILLASPFFQACGIINPNRMLDADKAYTGATFLNTSTPDFVIAQGDIVQVLVFTKNGYALFEPQISTQINGNTPETKNVPLDYSIDINGEANLPLVGHVKLAGLTIREAETLLAQKYASNYIDPFVNVKITNKYITVYRGGTDARQVILSRPDMTILEAIGAAGGVPENGKVSTITIVRKIDGQPQTEIIDLSEIESIAKANTVVLPNDVIYVEPAFNASIVREVAPILSALSSIVLIYVSLVNLNR